MGLVKQIWSHPREYLRQERPHHPVYFFSPAVLQATARRFLDGFPGLVTYAVKANCDAMVLQNLNAAGVGAFDVASVAEINAVQAVAPKAVLHFNNPVRSRAEITRAVALGVRSFSVDSLSELAKLAALTPVAQTEVSVRFTLDVAGAAYDFSAKFGADVDLATRMLAEAGRLGFVPSLTFHPGTQCTRPEAWVAYIETAAQIARGAGVTLSRLNVGGGFPSHRMRGEAPELEPIFAAIGAAVQTAFGIDAPDLVCEPGRGMVAESFSIATQVRAVRDGHDVFLNDGIYGGFAEMPLIGNSDRLELRGPDGTLRQGVLRPFTVFGPTCDGVDRLPDQLALPDDIAEEDYLLIHGHGAYSTATVTNFNGFGELRMATVMSLAG